MEIYRDKLSKRMWIRFSNLFRRKRSRRYARTSVNFTTLRFLSDVKFPGMIRFFTPLSVTQTFALHTARHAEIVMDIKQEIAKEIDAEVFEHIQNVVDAHVENPKKTIVLDSLNGVMGVTPDNPEGGE